MCMYIYMVRDVCVWGVESVRRRGEVGEKDEDVPVTVYHTIYHDQTTTTPRAH